MAMANGMTGWMSTVAVFIGLSILSVSNAEQDCTKVSVTEREGTLKSDNFPQQYYPNTCTIWEFYKEYQNVITLSFKYLDLPKDSYSGGCFTNYIEISSSSANKVICGEKEEPYTSSVNDKQIFLKFYSGSIPEGQGFELSYSIGPATSDSCNLNQFHCKSGKCILHNWKCNGYNECEDGSDEQDCFDKLHAKVASPAEQQQISLTPTPSGDCYQTLHFQMGNFSMPPPPFLASSIQDCIWHIYHPLLSSSIHLLFTELYLSDGANIQVFDGRNDLAARLGVFTSNKHYVTPVSLRSTGSHMLIKFYAPAITTSITRSAWLIFKAEYHYEESCELAGEMRCGQDDNFCYRQSQRCNGVWDCPHSGADEAGCDQCPENSFSCYDYNYKQSVKYRCYLRQDRCSGNNECNNYIDEKDCDEHSCSQIRNLFLCSNKHCILRDYLCDGSNDCFDNSDEIDCMLGSSRRVIVAAVVGSLMCALLLVLSLGFACKLYTLRQNSNNAHHHHHHHRNRHDTPLSRLQAELFRRRAPPPPYHEAMLTSRPYDEAVREYLAQAQAAQQPEAAGHENRGFEHSESMEPDTSTGDTSVQNLISLMDVSDEINVHHQSQSSAGEENQIPVEESNKSDSEEDADQIHDGDITRSEGDQGHIEMMENFTRRRPTTSNLLTEENESLLLENISEDSASSMFSAGSIDIGPVVSDSLNYLGRVEEISCSSGDSFDATMASRDGDSDTDSVCILCLDDDDPSATCDGSDTRCLLQAI